MRAAQTDLDLGSSGAIVIKDKYIITGGKQGPLYIADTANLGGYQPNANNTNVFEVLSLEHAEPAYSTLAHLLHVLQLRRKEAQVAEYGRSMC